jgi:hypothetical protein
MGLLDKLLAKLPGTTRPPSGGSSRTPTFQPYAPNYQLALPTYLDHLKDINVERQRNDSRALLRDLFKNDPDISATVHVYLTLADTAMLAVAKDLDGVPDLKATRRVNQVVNRITRQVDYTRGFTLKEHLRQLNSNLRYMALLRGGVAAELVLDAKRQSSGLRVVDGATLRWFEPEPGLYKPGQLVAGDDNPRLLDFPTFFVTFYRRDPTSVYTHSDFVSAINTVSARTQVINDLYRIMRITGFPRMDITVLENVVRDSAPLDVKSDAQKLSLYVAEQMQQLARQFENIRSDQALTHSDSIAIKILNDRASGVAVDVTPVIETLNAQNQAALKTMPTVLGRGQAGVNTGSVEARMAALYADQLNTPLAELWEKVLSYALHQEGFQGYVDVGFRPAELRPDTELEPQRLLKANRLRQDLSDGIITDFEYAMEMYGRPPHPDSPVLSGTGFMSPPTGDLNPADVSPNSDPLGRSISPEQDTKMTKANQPKGRSRKTKRA